MRSIFMKGIHLILNIVLVIVIFIMILVGYNYVQLRLLHKSYTNFGGYCIFEISTGSMKDTLNIYDVILVEITQDIKENDIITYQESDEIITHRVIKIEEDGITTKGDANNTEDKQIKKENVIGKVVSIYPHIGIWIRTFSEPKVLISICLTFILVGKIVIGTTEDDDKGEKTLGQILRKRRKRKEKKIEQGQREKKKTNSIL